MLFNSSLFIFAFFPIVILGYLYLNGISNRAGIIYLFLSSAVFWLYDGQKYFFVYYGSIIINFIFGHIIIKAPIKKRKPILVISIVANLFLLGFYKYANFIAEAINIDRIHELSLPLGISFFTFTQIAYLVDSYRDNRNERDPFRYGLFVSYFPHLIAGPIIHHKQVMPQLIQWVRPDAVTLSAALTLFAVGLAKKMIADIVAMAAQVDSVFDFAEHSIVGTQSAWPAALGYMIQLYFDFSAYCDMALAISLGLGIRLPVNFLSPYRATSIIDFWRRWHITLSQFLKDYLYIPLGGNRKGPGHRHLNLLITMVLGGFWHGAAWNFLIWGALHGGFLMINHLWSRSTFKFRQRRWWRLVAWMLTMGCVLIGWVFFRASTPNGALNVLIGMFNYNYAGLPTISDLLTMGTLLLILAIAALAPNVYEMMKDVQPGYLAPQSELRQTRFQWKPSFGWAVFTSLALAFGLLSADEVQTFLYFQF